MYKTVDRAGLVDRQRRNRLAENMDLAYKLGHLKPEELSKEAGCLANGTVVG